NGTVKFTSTTTGKTITDAPNNFYNLTLDGVGGGWTLSANLTVNHQFNITHGTFSLGSNNLTLTGSGTGASRPFINAGIFNGSTGTVIYQGSTATEIEATTYNNLSL